MTKNAPPPKPQRGKPIAKDAPTKVRTAKPNTNHSTVIKVGHRDVQVVKMRPHDGTAHAMYACFKTDVPSIEVDTTRKSSDQAEFFLHELLHAIWEDRDLPHEIEEQCVSALGKGLTATLRDNPEILIWITEALFKGKSLPFKET